MVGLPIFCESDLLGGSFLLGAETSSWFDVQFHVFFSITFTFLMVNCRIEVYFPILLV
jgi:hypothetical protein